jgi:dipeptidyl-peptidase-4
VVLALALPLAIAVPQTQVHAQDRLRSMPGWERYDSLRNDIQQSVRSGALRVTWSDDGESFEYVRDGMRYRYDIATRTATELGAPVQPAGRGGSGRGGGPARGRQFESAESPDGTHEAIYRDRNLWIRDSSGTETPITTDGSEEDRIKYGTASWVYGEELGQRTAMWWSPDGTKLAYYRFDESGVQDYYLQMDQTQIQSSLDTEAYPKAGTVNPLVDLFVYDLTTGGTVRVAVRDGKPFENDVVGHYVYAVEWSPDGTDLLIHRTNRRQNIMELAACGPATGACRAIVREEWPTGWVDNTPTMRFLEDGRRFIWGSERTGYLNYYLYDLSGEILATLTDHPFEAAGIERVDEAAGVMWYTARSGDNHMKVQLHRVGLDGRNGVRLTDPVLNHSVVIAPDGEYFIDVAQTHDQPPVTRLMDARGREVATIADSDLSHFDRLNLRKTEFFTYIAADGATTLYGSIDFPSNFDPSRKHPVLVPVYGGPASGSNVPREVFTPPHPYTEYGFLVVNVSSRAAPGMGKRTIDAIYEKLGVTEIDDMAEGVKALRDRPWVDADRVGMYGTSYGGYTSIMSLLRYPDVYAAAAASSPVTDWRHYDTIYTERYMYTPQDNAAGYDAGSAMTYVNDLKGRLMLYYGTADNNVHPSNMMQFIAALQNAGRSFELQVGPDRGHSGMNPDRMMEFFIENLVIRPSMNLTF